LNHEKGVDRLNCRGFFRRCGLRLHWRPGGRFASAQYKPLSWRWPYIGCRVLRGALSRLEPGAGKLARRVL